MGIRLGSLLLVLVLSQDARQGFSRWQGIFSCRILRIVHRIVKGFNSRIYPGKVVSKHNKAVDNNQIEIEDNHNNPPNNNNSSNNRHNKLRNNLNSSNPNSHSNNNSPRVEICFKMNWTNLLLMMLIDYSLNILKFYKFQIKESKWILNIILRQTNLSEDLYFKLTKHKDDPTKNWYLH